MQNHVVVDTSVIISVITNESHKPKLITLTQGKQLIAPSSLHWEIGNAFSAMFKRKRISFEQAVAAIKTYQNIPIRFEESKLEESLALAHNLEIYAYDAYFIECALRFNIPLITLDNGLLNAAKKANALVEEVES
jgi:predicted nucleic acid-binding protein